MSRLRCHGVWSRWQRGAARAANAKATVLGERMPVRLRGAPGLTELQTPMVRNLTHCARRAFSVGAGAAVPAEIDTDAYPLHDVSRCEALLQRCTDQIREVGYCHLPRFIRPAAVERCVLEYKSLESQDKGFRSFESHNVYLEENVVSYGMGCAGTPLRQKEFASSKYLIAQDALAEFSPLLTLYRWTPLQEFMRQVFSLDSLHPSADPYGGVYYNKFDAEYNDALGWHFDRSKFSMNLILQTVGPGNGGEFQYVQDSRPAIDAMSTWEAVENHIDDKIETPELAPGSLYLFAGNRSLHRVSPVTSGTRINAILTYFETPGQKLNEYTLKKFFGRTHGSS